MPDSLPNSIRKILQEQELGIAELSPETVRALIAVEQSTASFQQAYQILSDQYDIVFHVDHQFSVLWYKADQHLQQHIPVGLSCHRSIREFIPRDQVDGILSALAEPLSTADHSPVNLYLGGSGQTSADYQCKTLDAGDGGRYLLLTRKQGHVVSTSKAPAYDRFNSMLIQLARRLHQFVSRKQLYATAAETCLQALELDQASVWLFDEEQQTLTPHFFLPECVKTALPSPLNREVHPEYFHALLNLRTYQPDQAKRPDRHAGRLTLNDIYDVRTLAAIEAPIRLEGHVIGVLRAELFNERDKWSANDHAFLVGMADLLAQAEEIQRKDEALTALYQSERRFRDLTENSETAIFAFEECFLYANPALEEMTGLVFDELIDKGIAQVFNKHFDAMHKQAHHGHLSDSGEEGKVKLEVEISTPSGEKRWIYVTSTRSTYDGDACWLASAFDITERKTSEARLKFQAHHDHLTGLPNRLRFQDRIGAGLSRASRDPFYKVAVLYVNIDRFKVFNDSMGQLLGDQLLLELSKRIRLCLRPTDMIARISGDEFAVYLDNIFDSEDVVRIVNSVQNAVQEPFHFDDQETVCTASIGIVLADKRYEKPEYVLRDASIAMYHAKNESKSGHRFFDPSMHERAKRILETESELRAAIRKQSLELYYQPIVRLSDQRVCYFEALIRWHKGSNTTISPLDFIPLAEESRVILSLGRWVIERASAQLAEWQYNGWAGVGISINVSGKQFQSAGLSNEVKEALKKHNIQKGSLKIEITESSMIENSDTIQEQLLFLRELGCELLVDDFGTGYSSLSYLHQFPVNCIKIDRSFISILRIDEDSQEIVKAITNLAHNLKLDVVAEGVETQEQAEILKEIGCDYVQGYYFSPPLPASEAMRILSNENGIINRLKNI